MKLQYKSNITDKWEDLKSYEQGYVLNNDFTWRIKPEQSEVELLPLDQLPSNFWIKLKNYGSLWKRITAISIGNRSRNKVDYAIGYLTDEKIPIQKWLQIDPVSKDPYEWEWSEDRVTAKQFYTYKITL